MGIHFLTGNSFPLNLIRRAVRIEPETLEHYLRKLEDEPWESYWGHENTLAAVNAITGKDLRPRQMRPALELDADGYPALFGKTYRECWVLSPDYESGYRPGLKEEVEADRIRSWHVLRIVWE